MFCANCSKLAILHMQKSCLRCQGKVFNNISVLCDFCSTTNKICSACLKNIVPPKLSFKGCGCGK